MKFVSCHILIRFQIAIVVLVLTSFSPSPSNANSSEDLKFKANFVSLLMKYVQNKSTNNICVTGDNQLLNALKSSPKKANIITLTGQDISGCSVVFVGKGATSYGSIIKVADTKSIVTVSDKGGFLNQGGLVELYEKDGKIKFAINLKKAGVVKVKFDSRLVELADRTI